MPKFVRARQALDNSEAKKVRRLAGARHAPSDWSARARIIALSWEGPAVPVIAGQLGCHPNKVRRGLRRFNAAGAYQAFLQLAEDANPEGAIWFITGNLALVGQLGPSAHPERSWL